MESPARQTTSFLDTIGRSDIKSALTPSSPWAYFSMEIGLPFFSFAGGLGILAGDTFLQASKVNIPFVGITLFYPVKWTQHLKDFGQVEEFGEIHPSDFNFKKECDVKIFANNDTINLEVYSREMNKTKIIVLYEPGLKELYHGDSRSEHRLYQETVLGFGGVAALSKLGYEPAIIHLNESSAVFGAIALLDNLCASGLSFEQAIKDTGKKVLFTNHTLVPAATACFPKDYLERYVFKNIKTESIKTWISDIINSVGGPCLHLSYLAIGLTEKINGVSKIHSKIASDTFKKVDGSAVNFMPVTNGIYLQRWVTRELYRLYWQTEIIDQFDLPGIDYKEKIDRLGDLFFSHIKMEAKLQLLDYLRERMDEFGNPVVIEDDAKIAVWAKRFATYKRPGMIFENQERLVRILEENDIRLVISGDIHLTGTETKQEVKDILSRVNASPGLAKRVHFVQDYDQTLAKYLTTGADIWLNTPEVGKEACGTSWMKAIANLGLLISTPDGGVADQDSGGYLKITGSNYQEEVDSLYNNLETAATMIDDKKKWLEFVKKQLQVYLPIMSGGRMLSDYLECAFPK